jgi:hypothetical protein
VPSSLARQAKAGFEQCERSHSLHLWASLTTIVRGRVTAGRHEDNTTYFTNEGVCTGMRHRWHRPFDTCFDRTYRSCHSCLLSHSSLPQPNSLVQVPPVRSRVRSLARASRYQCVLYALTPLSRMRARCMLDAVRCSLEKRDGRRQHGCSRLEAGTTRPQTRDCGLDGPMA